MGRAQELAEFAFHDPGSLVDGDLELVLAEQYPGNRVLGWVPAYRFKMVRTGSDTEMGRIELRVGDTLALRRYSGHIGYHVWPRFRGHRCAARACRLLLPLARRHGMTQLWITCNPDNLASRRTCELAGAEFVEIVDLPKDSDMYRRGERQKCRYRLDLAVGEPGLVSTGASLAGHSAPETGEGRLGGGAGAT